MLVVTAAVHDVHAAAPYVCTRNVSVERGGGVYRDSRHFESPSPPGHGTNDDEHNFLSILPVAAAAAVYT